jgi:sugar phosphate isomerase/epimerase
METHPPLGENGDKAKKTLDAVDHPGLRFNFDTANVYYYNEGTDTITELKKVAQYVASVHLKDTDGGFKSPNFPPLGQGIVDFKGVFDVLRDVNFEGPYTLEIEGANVSGLDAQGRLEFLRTCVAFLHDMGAVK